MKRLIAVAVVAALASVASANIYATGFEATEGFATGFIGGQNGWSAFSASTVEGHVDTVNPASGAQHLRISNDPAAGAGNYVGGFSPDWGPQPAGQYTVSVDVCIGATGGADYDIVPQAPSQSFLTARVKYFWDDYDLDGTPGDVVVLDDDGTGLTYYDTGYDYTPGVYHNLTIDIDAIGNTIDYYFDGTLAYSGMAGVFAGTSVEQVVFLCDNWNAGESGDFDNLLVTPEPTSLVLLALGGLALIRRR